MNNPTAFFLEGTAGRLFCTGSISDEAAGPGHSVVILPPFADEMNKSRHVLAAVVRALGSAGHNVLMPDLYGTGDSEGDFGDATLDIWRSDIDTTIERLSPHGTVDIVGLRAGALFAVDAALRYRVGSLVLINPLLDGKQLLNQTFRLHLASALKGGGRGGTITKLKQRLVAGEVLEIGGYPMTWQLVHELEELSLYGMTTNDVDRIHWVDLSVRSNRVGVTAGQGVRDTWVEAGIPVSVTHADCEEFWSTQELAPCPGMVQAVTRCLSR